MYKADLFGERVPGHMPGRLAAVVLRRHVGERAEFPAKVCLIVVAGALRHLAEGEIRCTGEVRSTDEARYAHVLHRADAEVRCHQAPEMPGGNRERSSRGSDRVILARLPQQGAGMLHRLRTPQWAQPTRKPLNE